MRKIHRFPTNVFNVVSSRHVLFTLPRPGVAVRQWARVLKPGGKMILIGNDDKECENWSLSILAERVGARFKKWFAGKSKTGCPSCRSFMVMNWKTLPVLGVVMTFG